ncbi:hypothetical protein C1I98_15825 [Spongiactinospora gelatinilytica]|uniref:DUF1648 domain-containing protein n=1 Tax=Spongiactinospora gelatinilytica TaxID=2666298 RepID=A0A2W2H728_9ACTN|nr:hypothetical protein [Spongiactinospora gelatinilytica]PZG45248.1 hypothetical protein C1I98_15825 [Spongiactinospora gelatinilytica]
MIRRRALLVALPWGLIVIAALLAVPLALRSRLPDPMAVHWSADGVADTTLPFGPAISLGVAMWGITWLALLAVAARGAMLSRRQGRMLWWGLLSGAAVFSFGMQLITVLANLDGASGSPGLWAVLVIAAALAAGAPAAWLGRGGPDPAIEPAAPPTEIRLRPGRRAWVSRATNQWLVALTICMAFAGVAGYLVVAWAVIPIFAILVFGLFTSSVRVKVNDAGVLIGYGWLRWPVRRIALSSVDRAWAEERFPSQVGGWGVRGMPGSSTIMLRGGQCLVIRDTDGGTIAVSVDDAETGASLINALRLAA